jgi:hypothetical protein
MHTGEKELWIAQDGGEYDPGGQIDHQSWFQRVENPLFGA